jgi:putative transposase
MARRFQCLTLKATGFQPYNVGRYTLSMIRTLVYRFPPSTPAQRQQIRDAQMEAARVYDLCCEMHRATRAERAPWPKLMDFQAATRGGKFALHSQTTQLVFHEFLANVETACELRRGGDRRAQYPKKSAKYRPLMWPAQAVRVEENRLLFPMGRGRKSLVFDRPHDFPADFGNVKLCFDGGRYALHVPVEIPDVQVGEGGVHAAIDLGEIHLGALVTTEGDALVVSGRGIRSDKRLRHKQLGEIAKKRSKCKKGSRRHRRLNFARKKLTARTERKVRDKRHKGTRLLVDAATALDVTDLFVGDPHGVRKRDSGRKHNQRMSGWEYGKDKDYLAHKGEAAGISMSFGDERGTSSTCPKCLKRHKPRGRVFACPHCGLVCHRDVVGGVNQNRKAWGLAQITVPDSRRITYLRPGHASLRDALATPRLNTKELSVSSSRPDTGHEEAQVVGTRVAVASTKTKSAGTGQPGPAKRMSASIGQRRSNSEAHPL